MSQQKGTQIPENYCLYIWKTDGIYTINNALRKIKWQAGNDQD